MAQADPGYDPGPSARVAAGLPEVAPEYPRDIDELHRRMVAWFEEAERATADARELSERDRDYLDNRQWTAPEREALRKRGQPEITINKIREKIGLLCGLERKSRSDPKAYPRTPTEEERADAATQALRFIGDDNNINVIRSTVYEEMLVEGFGGVEIGLEDDGQGGASITLTHVPWDRLWYDPHSRAADFSDARYKGVVVWMDRDQLDELYPDAGDTISDSFADTGGSYDDRPTDVAWSDTKRERVRIVQCHWVERGVWWTATISKPGFLTLPQRSPFLDRKGRSCCPLMLQSAYIDRDNQRYGIVRGLISLQDEINKRRSKALHLLSVRQTITEQGAVEDVDAARREVAKPDGFITVLPGMRFEIVPGGDLAAGQFQLLQHATGEMQLAGPNAAMAGTDPRDQSGRAIIAQQAGGAAANEPLSDALRQWMRRVYETCWMAARQYWTAGKWVRVTDDIGSTRWVGINQQITVQDKLAEMDPEMRAQTMQRMQIFPGDPRLHQVLGVRNDISDLEVDITIEEGADVPAIAAEQFMQLAQLAQAQPGIIPPDVLIAASGLRNKQELLDRMKQAQEQQAQIGPQQAQLAMANAQAEIRQKNAKAMADEALAKEREHAAVHHVADVHDMHARRGMPETTGGQMEPFASANALAQIRNTDAKTATELAKQQDLQMSAIERAARAKATLHPPPRPQGAKP